MESSLGRAIPNGRITDAELVLVAHQRRDIGSCLCGWSELGKSHPGHQVAMLQAAGLLAKSHAE